MRSEIVENCRRLDLVQTGRYNQADYEHRLVDQESLCREMNNEALLAAV